MSNMNRLANVNNRFQGVFKRVLCVCSAGRSPTIAWVLSNDPYNCNVRTAGVVEDPVDEVLLEWADEIVCAEEHHAQAIREMLDNFVITPKPVHSLDVLDQHGFLDPKLVKAIEAALLKIKFTGAL